MTNETQDKLPKAAAYPDKLDPQVIVIAQVISERKHQDMQWGGPSHDDKHNIFDWFSYIGHQADLSFETLAVNGLYGYREQLEQPIPPAVQKVVRARLIKIAALAVAAVESIDRKTK